MLFLKARKAGHPAGSMIVEKKTRTDTDIDSESESESVKSDIDSDKSSSSSSNGRSNKYNSIHALTFTVNHNITAIGTTAPTVWSFSDRGVAFVEQYVDFIESHGSIEEGTNKTFRDMYYDSYQSVYTGTKPRKFSKLWMDVDDISGDIDVDVEDGDDDNIDDDDDDVDTSSQKPQNSEL